VKRETRARLARVAEDDDVASAALGAHLDRCGLARCAARAPGIVGRTFTLTLSVLVFHVRRAAPMLAQPVLKERP